MNMMHTHSSLVVLLLATIQCIHACLLHGIDPAAVDGYDPWSVHMETREVPTPPKTKTALVNVRVFDGYQIREPSTVIIDGDVISADETNIDSVIDGLGRIVMPGLIDSHCHPQNITDLEKLTSYGVTTAFNMACFNYPLCHFLSKQVGLASFFTAGIPAQAPGSLHARLFHTPLNETISSPSEAENFVSYAFGNGSDYYKITAEFGGPSQDTQNALVAAAHKLGKKTMTHAAGLETYNQAINSKTDGIQHTPPDGLITHAMISKIIKQKQYITPTMNIFKLLLPDPIARNLTGYTGANSTYDHVRSNVRAMHEAGLPLIAGTDAFDQNPLLLVPMGITLHFELENLVDAGFTPAEALRAATILPSLLHGLNDRGVIEPGKRADLLLLNQNPLVNISNSRDIAKIWVGGIEYPDVASP
jgi:imidazolonepropionase-like amidohydrolase